ncbi:MAG: suppressor of fused domain protein [Phycisphaerales bacterium]|nr:suppressor of fused domain protein [Phycisphaerales bacterium]
MSNQPDDKLLETGFDRKQQWLERVWQQREDVVYPKLFGAMAPSIQTVPEKLFLRLLSAHRPAAPADATAPAPGPPTIQPWWLSHGVLTSRPNANRSSWLYVTTALSNPWGEAPDERHPGGYSGLGFEFIIECATEARWPLDVLHWLIAMQVLTACGELEGGLVEPMDRIALGGPLDGSADCLLRNVLLLAHPHLPAQMELDSGKLDLLLCVGITDAEMAFARSQGGESLGQLLAHNDYLPVTNPKRASAV